MKFSFTNIVEIVLLLSSPAWSVPVNHTDNLLSTAQELRYILNKYDAAANLQADDIALAKLPLTDGPMDNRYYGTVLIGTPGQALELLIDTGSSPLVISAAGCETCSGEGRYDSSASDSYIPAKGSHWSLGYQDGSKTEGTNGFDSITIGDMTARNQVMFVATSMSPNFDVFLGHESTGGGGEVVFGGIDQERIAEGGEITYTDVTEAKFWKINVQDVLVDDVSAEGLDDNTGYAAVIDTGANFMVLPGHLPEQINSKIKGSRKFGTIWTVPCKGTSIVKFKI
ncbi:hypothetical protein BGZ67_006865 [Mortierella alpina]|nr:hypothetical protein BGZ67_006865 [Mortierella alpina]